MKIYNRLPELVSRFTRTGTPNSCNDCNYPCSFLLLYFLQKAQDSQEQCRSPQQEIRVF